MIATTSSEQKIYYWATGTGRPLILVHSAMCDADSMRPLSDQLESEFRCIALDRVGYQLRNPPGADESKELHPAQPDKGEGT